MSIKIVINACFGGFSLSNRAIQEYADRKGIPRNAIRNREIPRDDHDLIAVVEDLGAAANGLAAYLEIIQIPDGVDWQIEEYDGSEHVAEKHRTWP